MSALYTITGLPYSGKTTLRNVLVNQFGFNFVSVDEIMDANDVWKDEHPTQEDWNNAYKQAYDTLKDRLREGRSVVFDGGSLQYHEREVQRKIAEEMGAKRVLIFVDTPIEVIQKRRLQNQITNERGHVVDEVMKKALSMFEKPTEDENAIVYDGSFSVEEWISKYILDPESSSG